MNEALIVNLDRLWFDFNYGGLAVSESEMLGWEYFKIRKIIDWFTQQKKLEEEEIQKAKNKTSR